MGVRRLHDVNRTGWWQLLSLAAFVATQVQTRFVPTTLAAMTSPQRLTAGDTVIKTTAMIVSLVASVVLFVFDVSPPVPAGERFDRPAA